MKTGRNLPRGRANQENQQELQRMERRDLGKNASASGNPWDTLMHKTDAPHPRGRKPYISLDWGHLAALLVIAAAVVLFAVLSSAKAEGSFITAITHFSIAPWL